MKIYIIVVDADDYGGTFSGKETSILRAFRNRTHALNVKKKLHKEDKDSDFYLKELELED